ncbi:MAG: bifunctional UDP-N-acetylglucosamine diphosphorylase/glucosamine-1-phosphate N-acetyltransferase GlmU [Parvibaculaceae bacterium]
MKKNDTTIVILAAGKGTRMKSSLPKVLHEAAGRPLLGHVVEISKAVDPSGIVVVVAPSMDDVAEYAQSLGDFVQTCVQASPKGTGDAARSALELVPSDPGTVVFFNGDTALIEPETIKAMCDACSAGAAVTVLGFEAADPTNYGRLVCDAGGAPLRIVEEKDASAEERKLTLCNGGAMAIAREHFHDLLGSLSESPASGEYYITELPELARAKGLRCAAIVRPEAEIFGVDSREDLAFAESVLQGKLRKKFLNNGVTLREPQSVYFCMDTEIGRDVVIEPQVVFGPGVSIGDNVTIKAFSHLEGASVGEGCSVGPFARLRPGTVLGEGAKIGNFVETKKASIEAGAKVSHLTYIGDARVGADANIGAGTITCNYDGFNKHFTDIGAGAFVGSNSSLVAPVKVGDGAYVGSGSVVTRDVEADALAVARGQQAEKPGWAARFRKAQQARKAKKD